MIPHLFSFGIGVCVHASLFSKEDRGNGSFSDSPSPLDAITLPVLLSTLAVSDVAPVDPVLVSTMLLPLEVESAFPFTFEVLLLLASLEFDDLVTPPLYMSPCQEFEG